MAWIPAFGIDYHLGVDGISLWLVVLTGFLTPISLLCSWESIEKKTRAFVFFVLALEAFMIGVFLALDLFLFYVFWDAMLIPMYFLIGVWGYDRRIYAAVKFMLYTMAGSVLMLVAILGLAYLHSQATGAYSFDYLRLLSLEIAPATQYWWFLAFAVAFAIKVPLFPFHTWLPDAHVEAPTAGSVILAGVLLKMGTYGLIRFAFPLFPDAAAFFAPYIAVLAVVGIVYGALVAMVQPDMKKLVAYSSVSHLGFVVLGICALNANGLQGAVYQMIAHGVSTGGLFLVVGMLSERRHTRLICGVRRAQGRRPAADRRVPHHHAVVDRPAEPQRVHRRVPRPAGRLPVGSALCGRGGQRRDPVRGLHAVDGAARVLRRGHQRGEQAPARSHAARVGGDRAGRGDGHRDGPVPDAVSCPDRAGHRQARAARVAGPADERAAPSTGHRA